ncbi:cytochrome P450 2K1-like [Arapaima gigas]
MSVLTALMADSASVTLILIFTTLLFLLFKFSFKSNKYRFPPGPRPWRIIGNLDILDKRRSDDTMCNTTLSTLQDFGMGRSTIEDHIVEEAQRLVQVFQEHQALLPPGKPFNPTVSISSAVSNVICQLVFGCRFEYDDPIFLQLQRRVSENLQLFTSPEILVCFTLLQTGFTFTLRTEFR